jgi:hypothetical protein
VQKNPKVLLAAIEGPTKDLPRPELEDHRLDLWWHRQSPSLMRVLPAFSLVRERPESTGFLGASIEGIEVLSAEGPSTVRDTRAKLEVQRIEWSCPQTDFGEPMVGAAS